MYKLTTNYFKAILVILAPLLVTACATGNGGGHFEKRSNAYLAAQDHPYLALPPGLSRDNLNSYYSIPTIEGEPSTNIAPPGSLAANPDARSASYSNASLSSASSSSAITSRGNQDVLIVDGDIDQVWVAIAQSLERQRIKILGENKDLYKYYIVGSNYAVEPIQNEDIYHINLVAQEGSVMVAITDYQGDPLGNSNNRSLLSRIDQGL
ncbi:MAG: hypothetical protein V3V61_05675 [Gammaproteobacteria bacterium]